MIESKLNTADLYNKKVFLRADLNVPIKNGFILDDFKLSALKPTLDLLVSKSSIIVLGTHLGRPKGKKDNSLSTKPLADWLDNHGYTVKFAKDLQEAQELIKQSKSSSIVMLENLRFYSGEKNYSKEFAEELYNLAPDYYINDAFGAIHREDTSIALLPKLYDLKNKSVGLLIEKEINGLSRIKDNPRPPFVLIMGGAKVKSKLPLIKELLNKATSILLLPPLVFTFLKAQNKEVGKSLVEEDLVNETKKTIDKAKEKNVEILFPDDYLIAQDSISGELSYKDALDKNSFGISIGPKTLEKYKQHIIARSNANTLFFNGTMGFLDRPETTKELKSLLQTVTQSDAYTVIGGGDSVAAVNIFGLAPAFDFISTGGGATLTYLSNQYLPGLINTIS